MDLFIEIIMWVVVATIVEILVWAIGIFIAKRWKWHPLKNKTEKAVADITDKTFVMIADSDTKAVQILALVFAILGYVLGIALPVIMYVIKQVEWLDFIILMLTFQALLLPMLIAALHYTTKKIYFSDDEIIIKSITYFKKICINQIEEVSETNYSPAILMLLIKYDNSKKFKIKQNFINYALAKKRFTDMQLLI